MANTEQPDSNTRVAQTIQLKARILKPLRNRIRQAAAQAVVRQEVVEKDYAISYIIAGIFSQQALSHSLVFKGGTALKKLLFDTYRFSEDLDFSTVEAPRGAAIEEALRQAMGETQRRLRAHGPFDLVTERLTLREPHPHGQDAFTIRVKFPWHPNPLCRIKVEITHDEPVLLPPQRRDLIHGYDEELAVQVLCYRLDEVVAEKMRTLLQTQQKLAERGWNRPRARDYYDLWRILKEFGDTLERDQLPDMLQQKCAHRGVSFSSLDDFFTEQLAAEARMNWERNLGSFVQDLPPCDEVLAGLRTLIPSFFPEMA